MEEGKSEVREVSRKLNKGRPAGLRIKEGVRGTFYYKWDH